MIELKANNADGEAIGEYYISALANSAALEGKAAGYLVWGIDDATHDVVGTSFLACALGHAACRVGHDVMFVRADVMLRQLHQSRADLSTERVMRRLLAPDLLIIDDFGLRRLDHRHRGPAGARHAGEGALSVQRRAVLRLHEERSHQARECSGGSEAGFRP